MHNLKNLSRAGAGVILILALASMLVQRTTSAANKSAAPVRGYYLTQGGYDGSQALNACVAGYHMASLWEIHEPSNLRYDTALGLTKADSGSGPPVYSGWIRTGEDSSSNSGVPGVVNCDAWTSNSAVGSGTTALLRGNWIDSTLSNSVNPWQGAGFNCSFAVPVWCVQD
jgi:hypothetical protein